MKINLPVFKDEDAKDTVTYQRWRWDLMVYWCVGCRDHTLLPYAIQSLQGYPGKVVRSSGMDITLDDVLTILDEHYNNMKALDAQNQELFQLQMADKETVLVWVSICQDISRLWLFPFPATFTQLSDRVKERLLLWWAPKVTESNGSLSEGGSAGKDLFRPLKGHPRSQEGRFHGVALGSQDTGNEYCSQTKGYQFLPPEETQGQPPIPKKPAVHLAHLEEEDTGDDEDQESDNLGRIEGVTEEFMVYLARAVKDAQADEKCCYHCSSP